METIIVTGLSGAGKSHAIHCMEDLGYYCIDNIPPRLMGEFLRLAQNGSMKIEKVAFVIDIRGGEFFKDLKMSLDELKAQGTEFKIMFLEASDAVLVRRYKETRRSHPLAQGTTTQQGIAAEREMLSEIRKEATYIIDTSNMKSANLNEEIKRLLLSEEDGESFTITVMSFGFKNGMPQEADWVLDARFLPNPFYVPSLKKLTGNNKKVRDYVMKSKLAKDFAGRIVGLACDLIPSYIKEGKYHLVIAIGCTGGQHRSVALANEIGERLRELDKPVVVIHREQEVHH
ncbi:MAG: RNase adapter RapZ [Clostridia bacterium]|nr:RNase adapter RapZ [Clostridia bacterium]